MAPQVSADRVPIGEVLQVALETKASSHKTYPRSWRRLIRTYGQSLDEDSFRKEIRQHPQHSSTLRIHRTTRHHRDDRLQQQDRVLASGVSTSLDTLLYEMASNCSLICSGNRTLFSSEDRG